MRSKHNIDGYTLLELMITILIGSIITLATTTILLLGLRLNNESNETVTNQNTVRVLLTALEDVVTEGKIKKVDSTTSTWTIQSEGETNAETDDIIMFSYSAADKAIYSGSIESGNVLLEGVIASHVFISEDKVLTFSVETKHGTYSSSVYCRTTPEVSAVKKNELFEEVKNETITIDGDGSQTSEARKAFLKVLASQYGSNGVIIAPDSTTLTYYSQWYIGNDKWGSVESGTTWNANTPWCACFLSWALAQMPTQYITNVPHESHVSKYYEYFAGVTNDPYIWKTNNPIPGDIIFFDWDPEKDNGYDHVGAVLKVDTANNIIYTIEGNTANMVAVRSYKIDDPDIVGYGVLNWIPNQESPDPADQQ